MITNYIIHVAIVMLIYVILATSLNLALGYTGLLNLGHVAFFGIGAYASALLMKNMGVPFFVALVSAGILAAFFGFVLAYATRKLSGDYLALATLGFNFVVYSLMLNWTSLTRGSLGITGVPRPSFFGLVIKTPLAYVLFVGIITALCVYCIHRIVQSPYGRLLEAVRDDEIGLSVLGKNTFKIKWQSMSISAFFAGVAGSLYAHYITFIDPTSFALTEIIIIFTIVIVGGLASLKGSVVASIIIITLPELLRLLAIPSHILGPMRQILYAVILLVILIYRPRGIFGRVDLE